MNTFEINKESKWGRIVFFPFAFKSFFSVTKKEKWSKAFLSFVALFAIFIFILFIIYMFKASWKSILEFGPSFITSNSWNPVEDEFGALAFLYGTVVTSFLAVCMAAPLSIGVAIFINEVCSENIGKIVSVFVEMIAAVPSIVFGLWALFYLSPWVKNSIAPPLTALADYIPIFKGPSFGIGILTASLILAIMIVPTISSICREVFKNIPSHQKEAALALGATRYEMIKLSILMPSISGIMGAVVLGLGRALGETMAVAMVIGNSAKITFSIFAPAATMASVIANEYAEAENDLHLSSLAFIGLLLFLVTLIVNGLSRYIVWRVLGSKKEK